MHVESQPTVALQNSTDHVVQKRQREESSDEGGNTKKRKLVDVSNESASQANQDDSPTVTKVDPDLKQETSTNDELLELLASWQ